MAEIREIKVAFTDYRADLTLDVGFEGNIPVDAPLLALPEVVNINITNSLSDGSAIAYYKNADNVDVSTILYANTNLEVLKSTKVSIARANPRLFNITNIKVTSQNGTLLKDTNANLFDLENIQQPQTINITSEKLLTTENLARFITVLDSAYKFNTEIENEYTINVATQNATYVKYYFPNQPGADANGAKIVPVTQGSANIVLSNPNAVGIYELVIIAGNEILKDGDEQRARINVIRERTYGQPDVTNIIFDRNITEADLRPLDFDFNFDIDTVNSEGVDVFLGDNLIFNTPISNGEAKIKLPAKSLYNSYKTFFNESDANYEITFSLQPYFNGIGGKIVGKKESFTIFVDRAKNLISNGEVLDVLTGAFSQLFSGNDTKANFEDKIVFEDDKHLYYQIKTDNDSSFVITNTGVDDVTFSLENGKIVPSRFEVDPENGSTKKARNQNTYNSLVVKLLEPIDENVVENQLVWISKQIIPSIVETIIINDSDNNECIALKPNFTVDVVDETGFEFFNQIISSGSVTSTDIVNQYLSKSQFSLEDLNIDYTSGSDVTSSYFLVFDNFVNFSSAKTRIENFQYKIETIENWENKITSTLYSASVLSTSSISLLTSASYNDKINSIRNGFDGFEKKMYFDYGVSSSNAQFFEIQTDYGDVYDRNNKNYLVKHLPQYIQEDTSSNEFLIFMEMIGQHFDVIWSYINGINRIRKISNKSTDGISDKLVYTLLESFGWDPAQPFNGHQLWKQAFGLNEDGSTNSNSNVLGNDVGSSFTPEQARNQVWRRILNNLPYLLKHKGTKKAINAIMACYGVPSSLLTIVEFGGPANSGSQSTKYTYEDRTAALNIERAEYLTVDWKEGTSFNDPDAIELRFKTSKLPFVTPQLTTLYQTQSLVNIGGAGSGIWDVKLIPSGSTIYGDIVFQMSASSNVYIGPGLVNSGSELVSMSIQNVPIFDNTFKHFTIQREVISRNEYVGNTLTRSLDYEQYTMYYKQANGDRISLSESDTLDLLITSGSGSLVSNAKYYNGISWLSGSTINFGGQNAGGISGSIDEVRIWGGALSESVVTSHTLNPDTIFGNDVYSSTSDLFFRLDFEYPKNRQISGSGITSGDMFIKNVAPFVTYTSSLDANNKEIVVSGYSGYATASIFTTASSYPYHYDVYERFVTAEVPSIGFVGKDKVRTEDITLTGQLSYKQRATKKAYDRAPIDSNRLGLFFSPVKEINLDILRSLGPINIGDYIGDWDDEYGTDTYRDLDQLRNYYFERTQLNFDEYIKLIKSIDKSLFDMLTQVIPVRANVSKGLLIEPSLLERSKIKITKPVAENILHTASINTMETTLIEMSVPTYTGSLNMNDGITIEATIPYYSGSYDIIENLNITTEYPTFGGNYSVIDNITSSASILSNLANAGGIVIEIDCGLQNPTILGEVDLEDAYQQVGNDPDSPFNKGFGLIGFNGAVDRTYYKDSGNLVLTERYNSYIITVKYTRSIPKRVPANGLSGSLFNTSKLSPTDKVVLEKVNRYEKKLILIEPIDYSPSVNPPAFRGPLLHSFYIDILANLGTYPYKNGVIIAIEPFSGLTSGHYSNTKDTSRGLENSFYGGAKQTSRTTLDGTPAVESFSTNPNRLRVGASGRGSGEPILEVD
jgi:hypothetical protein